MQIEVTKRDIAEATNFTGTRIKSDWGCPIACALKRAKLFDGDVRVGSQEITTSDENFFVDLPSEARQFILDWDEGRPVEPFEFEIKIEGE